MKVTANDRKQLKILLKGLGRRKTKEEVFYDLCFTLNAPQCKFENNIKVLAELKKAKFYEMPLPCELYDPDATFVEALQCLWYKNQFPELLKPVRFYNNKARYLIEAKINFDLIYEIATDEILFDDRRRELLVEKVKGLGMKAASHFLRNLGNQDFAIIDVHILKFMVENTKGCGDWGKELSRLRKKIANIKGYKNLEMDFQCLAGEYNMTTAELDALVWKNYSGTEWKDFTY